MKAGAVCRLSLKEIRMPLASGQTLQQRYRIVVLLGQGGMGAVYRAWDLRLAVHVALKEMTPQPGLDASMLVQLRQQFEQEAVTLARLSHPNLVRVTDFFEENGNAYLVMEFLEGESLAERIAREGKLPEAQVLAWAGQLLDALAYCHGQGIVHRDIKPQNVLLRSDGRAVLVDFGLVKLWNSTDPRTQTVLRGMGTPEYAPPEQYGRQGQTTDPRSDIYSLGAMLYHALTGQAPPTASDRIADPQIFRPIRMLNPRVSLPTEAAILRALEPMRDGRWTSAKAMAAALTDKSARYPSSNRRSGTAVMPQSAVRRRRVFGGWALGVVALGVLSVLSFNALGRIANPTLTPTLAIPITSTADLFIATGAVTEEPPLIAVTATTVVAIETPLLQLEPTATVTRQLQVPSLGDTRIREVDGMVLVYVPAGEFQMGSSRGEADEQPTHTVALDRFWLDRTEVTNAQYSQCVAAGRCPLADYAGDRMYNGATQPVVGVTWAAAVTYCDWVGARLLTEAEWEYAARGPEGWTYPWGNDFDGTRLNFCDQNCTYEWTDQTVNDGYAFGAPVGSYPTGASWVGALDLAGNVWEWGADWYGPYSSEFQKNPKGPASGSYRVLRGGSWYINELHVRGAGRHFRDPTLTNSNYGVRCAMSDLPG